MVVPYSTKGEYHCNLLSSVPPSLHLYRSPASLINPAYRSKKHSRTVTKLNYLLRFSNVSPISYSNLGEADSESYNDPNLGEAVITADNEIIVEVEKAGRNYRRIRSRTTIDASLESIWSVLTDYERLSDIVPSLVVSEIVETEGERVRLYQVGEQSFPLGLKFSAKVILDCFVKNLEVLSNGRRRNIEFKIVEGDFTLYEGKWSIEEIKDANDCVETCLWYYVDVKPKSWLPVGLIEGRLCKEIRVNLSCVREEAQKISLNC